MIFLKNLLFYSIVIVYTIIFSSIFVVILFFIRFLTSKRIAQKALRSIIVRYGTIITDYFARLLVKVKYIDSSKNITAKDPCVYVANHRSASDPFLLGHLGGEFVQIVNLWPFKIPILGICANLAGYLSVRSMSFDDFSCECKILFSQKVSIIGFPEGTRSNSSKMGQFHSTLFRVAKQNQLKIVPLCIFGNHDKPKRKSLKINPGNIEIHTLPAINPDEYNNFSSFELKNYVREKMQIFIDQHNNQLS